MAENVLKKIIVAIFGVIICVTFGSMLTYQYITEHSVTNPTQGHNLLYLAVGLVLSFGVFLFLRFIWKDKHISVKRLHIGMLIASAVLLMWQAVMLYCIYFETGWDMTCVYYDAVHRAEDGTLLGAHEYFTMYPHNVMLTFLLSLIFEIPAKLGIGRYYYFACAVGALQINIAGFLVFRCAFLLTNSKKTAVTTWGAYTVFWGLSPWMCVPYTDVYALLWPILIFTLYLEQPKKKLFEYGKWIVIGFLTIFGYEIKPTAAIISIAIAIMLFIQLLRQSMRKKSLICIGLMLAGMVLGLAFNAGARSYMGFIPDKNKQFPLAHYLMLGMNNETYGSFDGDDRLFTIDIPTWDEKIEKDLEVAKERFIGRGVIGNIDFFFYKNMVNFDNGTFSWAYEGEFFKDVPPKHDAFSLFLREIYYPDGKYYKTYATICQGMWVLLILGCVSILFIKDKEQLLVPMLTMVGLTIFLLLFEARGRYVIVCVPIYVMMGCIGLRNRYQSLYRKIQKR